MLSGMRLQVEVRHDKEDLLRRLAFEGHRSVREHASYLLDVILGEEKARLPLEAPAEPIAEVA